MIEKLSDRIIAYQVKKGILPEGQHVIYKYGYNLLLIRIANTCSLMGIAAVLDVYMEMLLFLLAFIPLRQYAGGYHLSKPWKCIVLSNMTVALVSIVMKYTEFFTQEMFQTVIIVVAMGIIFFLAPIDCANKRMDNTEKRVYRYRARTVSLIELIIYMSFTISDKMAMIRVGICFAYLLVGISLVLGKRYNN